MSDLLKTIQNKTAEVKATEGEVSRIRVSRSAYGKIKQFIQKVDVVDTDLMNDPYSLCLVGHMSNYPVFIDGSLGEDEYDIDSDKFHKVDTI